jgi:hypothetical protein
MLGIVVDGSVLGERLAQRSGHFPGNNKSSAIATIESTKMAR